MEYGEQNILTLGFLYSPAWEIEREDVQICTIVILAPINSEIGTGSKKNIFEIENNKTKKKKTYFSTFLFQFTLLVVGKIYLKINSPLKVNVFVQKYK